MNADFDITGIRLESNRLILREWELTDLDDFYEYCSAPGVMEMTGFAHHTDKDFSLSVLKRFKEEKHVFAIVYKENNKVIGSIGPEKYENECELTEFANYKGRELGFVLNKDYWGRGIMPEALQTLINYLFNELDYDFLLCGHFDNNNQSRRAQEKVGFKPYRKIFRYNYQGNLEPAVENLLINPHKNIKLVVSHPDSIIFNVE